MSISAQVTMSAVIGGTAEKLGGGKPACRRGHAGKFANGAVTGEYVMMFNHLGYQGVEKQKQTSREKLINEIANVIGCSATVVEEAMTFSYVTTDQLKDELVAAGHSTDKVDEILSRSATTGGIVRISGRLVFFGEVGYSLYSVYSNPTGANITMTASDLIFSGMATYGGFKGVGIAAVYYLGKETVFMTMRSLEQGLIKPNPNMTRNYIGGLMPVPMITK